MYATKSYELTAVMLLVCRDICTGFSVAPAPLLLPVDVAARSWGSGDRPTKRRARTDADSTVEVTFGLNVSVVCMVIYYLGA